MWVVVPKIRDDKFWQLFYIFLKIKISYLDFDSYIRSLVEQKNCLFASTVPLKEK